MTSGRSVPRQLTFRLNLDDEATFDNFYCEAGSRNAALISSLRQTIQARHTNAEQTVSGTVLRDFIWLFGAQGTGCSHLLQALCHDAGNLEMTAFYLDFSVHLATTETTVTPDVLLGLEAVSVVCLDSVELLAGHREWELALFNLYNRMVELQTPLIVAANTSPKYLHFTLADLASRMQSAAVFQLESPDDDTKASALKLRAQRRGFELSDDVAAYLVTRSERSMRSLLDALQKLDQHSLETQRKVTLPLLKTVMGW